MSDPQATHKPVVAGPFLKWAGGKASLLTQYKRYLPPPERYQRYVEPFVGGGAVFFWLQAHHGPKPARLADINRHLIGTYLTVRDRVEELIEALGDHQPDRESFERVREQDPDQLDPVAQAARFIYLNRTCYNGLYRVNRSGRFNVPYGKYKNPRICAPELLRAASVALAQTELLVADFAAAVADCGSGDFVYFDPPYVPLSETANFTEYADEGFGLDQQRRLVELICRLDDAGALVMASNSDTPIVRELYKLPDYMFPIRPITARRMIGCDATKRGIVGEVVIANYPLKEARHP
ncbi:MAG: DNA adenine methylase [Armatimonadetes bacterium]|nr:DNA adenine methylase [Armatimonadota bacterium]